MDRNIFAAPNFPSLTSFSAMDRLTGILRNAGHKFVIGYVINQEFSALMTAETVAVEKMPN